MSTNQREPTINPDKLLKKEDRIDIRTLSGNYCLIQEKVRVEVV